MNPTSLYKKKEFFHSYVCFTDSLSTTNRYVLMLKKKEKEKKRMRQNTARRLEIVLYLFFSACAIDIELKYESIQGKVFMFRIFFHDV